MRTPDALLSILQDALSDDNARRSAAEQKIDFLSTTPGFAVELASLSNSQREPDPTILIVPTAVRLLALSILKQRLPQFRVDDIYAVLEIILCVPGLSEGTPEPIVKLSAALASICLASLERLSCTGSDRVVELSFFNQALEKVCSMMKEVFRTADYTNPVILPQCWFTALMLSEMMEHLPSDSIIRDDLVQAVPQLFAFALSSSEGEQSMRTRLVMVKVLRDLYLWGISEKGVRSGCGRALRRHWENHWETLIILITTSCSVHQDEFRLLRVTLAFHTLSFAVDVLKAGQWLRDFSDAKLFSGVLRVLHVDRGDLCSAIIGGGDESDVVDKLAAQRLNLLGDMMRLKFMHKHVDAVIGDDNGLSYFQLLMAYARLPALTAVDVEDNANAFLLQEDEREDDLRWTARDTAAFVYRVTIKRLGLPFLRMSMEFLNSTLCDEGPEQERQDVCEREAALFLMDCVVANCDNELIQCGAADFSYFVSVLLKKDANGPPVLVARALLLLGHLIGFMHKQPMMDIRMLCGEMVAQSVASLTSSSRALIRAAACKLLHRIIPLCEASVVVNTFTTGHAALFSLLVDDASEGEFLYLVLTVLKCWLIRVRQTQLHCGNAAKVADFADIPLIPNAHSILLECWQAHIQDPALGDLIVGVFKELVRAESGDESLMTAALPWMQHVVSGQGDLPEHCTVPDVVRMLTCLFRHGSVRAANEAAGLVLGSLCTLLLTTDQHAVLDAASGCLASLLRRCPQASTVLVYVDPLLIQTYVPMATAYISDSLEVLQTRPLTIVYVAIVAAMLAVDKEESSLLNVGKLLVAIAESVSEFSQMEVGWLMQLIVGRLRTVSTDTVAQQLLSPLAILLKRYPQALLQCLLEEDLLQETFSLWLPRIGYFFGNRDIASACDALLNLLTHWPNQLLEGCQLSGWKDKKLARSCTWGATASTTQQGDVVRSDVTTASLPLNVAIFVGVAKGVAAFAMHFDPNEPWEVESVASECDNDSALFQDDSSASAEDEWEDADDAAVVAPLTASVVQGKQDCLAMEHLHNVFLPFITLWEQFADTTSFFCSTEEVSAIVSFLRWLQSPSLTTCV